MSETRPRLLFNRLLPIHKSSGLISCGSIVSAVLLGALLHFGMHLTQRYGPLPYLLWLPLFRRY